jgi:hypothetical protein
VGASFSYISGDPDDMEECKDPVRISNAALPFAKFEIEIVPHLGWRSG